MRGAELRRARDELRWSRQELAEAADLTVYRIAVIEQGKQDPTAEEVQALQRVLLDQLGNVLIETGEHPIVEAETPTDGGSTQGVWNGLRRGDEVRVSGEKGRFRFLYYFRDETQEYVQVFGPVRGTVPRSRRPQAEHQRSFLPERVVKV